MTVFFCRQCLLGRVPVSSPGNWKLVVKCKWQQQSVTLDWRPFYLSPIFALQFSIAIIRESVSAGTRLLGKVETSRGAILSLVEQKQSKDPIEIALRLLCQWVIYNWQSSLWTLTRWMTMDHPWSSGLGSQYLWEHHMVLSIKLMLLETRVRHLL